MKIRKPFLWALALHVCVLPALFGRPVIGEVASLYALASPGQPYFAQEHPFLLYCFLPIVVSSSFILMMAPGALFMLIRGAVRSFCEWLILGFASSLLLMIATGTLAKLFTGGSISSAAFLTIWIVLMECMMLVWITKREAGLPFKTKTDSRRVIWVLSAIYAGLVLLLPKIFWEDFNLDGIEAFEFGRSLSGHVFPHWEIFDRVFGFYSNFFLFAYPNHFFISIFGPFEASVRIPYLLYTVLIFCGLVLLIEWKKSDVMGVKEEAALWLGLIIFTIVQAFSTNYEPFFADLAETATPDLLQVVCFLSACYSLFARRIFWFWISGLMTFAAGPGGLLLLGCLAVAVFLSRIPERKELWKEAAMVLIACLFLRLLYEVFYIHMYLNGVNDQFSVTNMIRRLFPPTVAQFVRWNALLIPCGVLPALSLIVAARRRDRVEWVIAIITAVYFGVIYIQAWTSLHQFTIAMILPLIVFWRLYLNAKQSARRWIFPAVLITTLLSLILSLPRHFKINQAAREFGAFTSFEVGDYEREYERMLAAARSLYWLLPEDYRMQYPNQPWGTDHRVWIYYSTRSKAHGLIPNYFVRLDSASAPSETTMIRSAHGLAIYVRDSALWKKHREQKLPASPASPVYEPILAQTYQFFREYVAGARKGAQR